MMLLHVLNFLPVVHIRVYSLITYSRRRTEWRRRRIAQKEACTIVTTLIPYSRTLSSKIICWFIDVLNFIAMCSRLLSAPLAPQPSLLASTPHPSSVALISCAYTFNYLNRYSYTVFFDSICNVNLYTCTLKSLHNCCVHVLRARTRLYTNS